MFEFGGAKPLKPPRGDGIDRTPDPALAFERLIQRSFKSM